MNDCAEGKEGEENNNTCTCTKCLQLIRAECQWQCCDQRLCGNCYLQHTQCPCGTQVEPPAPFDESHACDRRSVRTWRRWRGLWRRRAEQTQCAGCRQHYCLTCLSSHRKCKSCPVRAYFCVDCTPDPRCECKSPTTFYCKDHQPRCQVCAKTAGQDHVQTYLYLCSFCDFRTSIRSCCVHDFATQLAATKLRLTVDHEIGCPEHSRCCKEHKLYYVVGSLCPQCVVGVLGTTMQHNLPLVLARLIGGYLDYVLD